MAMVSTSNYPHFPDEWLVPNYLGQTIANIPATVAALFDVPFAGLPPLSPELWQPLHGRIRRVVVILLDAFGWNLLQAEQTALNAELLHKAQIVAPITSIFPSTTVAALSSVWTGVGPAHHGLMGFTMFFPEYASGGQMLQLTPLFRKYPDALVEAGLQPEHFLQWPGMAEQLAAGGVQTHVFKDYGIADSALSKMHGRGTTATHDIYSFADLLTEMRHHLEATPGQPQYLHAYWSTIDSLSHYRLWDGQATRAEIRFLFHQIRTELIEKLSAVARQDTAVFIAADHGQIPFPDTQHIYLDKHPELERLLLMRPMGEARTAYFYARQGRQQDVLDYLNQNLGHALFALPAKQALDAGLFGPPIGSNAYHSVALERLGDVVAITRQGYGLWPRALRPLAKRMKGGHGGMTLGEMQVPWIGLHLEDW